MLGPSLLGGGHHVFSGLLVPDHFDNLKKRALTYPGEITKMINTMKNQSSRTLTLFEIGIFSFFKLVKEEIDVITFADLIGSLGGSLGMFFGFSISTCVIYLLDKCIMYIVHTV